jgi:fibronectin-binding autotransporter adhesin
LKNRHSVRAGATTSPWDSPDATNTLVLINSLDLNGGPSRRFQTIRRLGNVPEGELGGAVINSNPSNSSLNFDGNGGLIFDSSASTFNIGAAQINGGAIFVAAADDARTGNSSAALGELNTAIQVGSSSSVNPAGSAAGTYTTAGLNIAFMLYGDGSVTSPGATSSLNQGIGTSPTLASYRPINVGGTGVVYNSATLGIASDDYGAMNGAIALNEAATTPTTFTARNGGRVDFGGNITGVGSVVVGNSTVEGDNISTPGISLGNNGTIVFNGSDTYAGNTTITAGKLYVNSYLGSPSVSVGSGTTLGGKGTLAGAVTVASAGTLEVGQAGVGTLTINGGLAFNGPATINYLGLPTAGGGNPTLVVGGTNKLNTNGNTETIDILGSIPSFTGSFTMPGRGLFFLSSTAGSAAATWDVSGSGAISPFFDIEPEGNNSLTVQLGALSGSNLNAVVSAFGASTGVQTFQIGALGTNTTYVGQIANSTAGAAVALTKVGTGSLTLTHANSYSGGTNISGGTLSAISTALGTGTVAVNGGTIAVNDGTTQTAQALTTGSQTWYASSGYTARIFNDGSADKMNITAGTTPTLTIDPSVGTTGSFTVTASAATGSLSPTTSEDWVIAAVPNAPVGETAPTSGNPTVLATDANGVSSSSYGFILNVPPSLFSGAEAATPTLELEAVNGGGFSLDVVYSATPEPGTMLLVLAGVTPMLSARRRRRHDSSVKVG